MHTLSILIALAAATVVAALTWQHLRYLKARREVVHDRQPLLYPKQTFHVVTFLKAHSGEDIVESVRKLQSTLASLENAQLIYAGQAAFTALQSKQLPEVDWDAVVLTAYPSRAAYDALAASPGYSAALGHFDRHYSHGLQRRRGLNLAIPLLLLGVRLRDLLRRVPPRTPFRPAAQEQLDDRTRQAPERMARFDALRPLGEGAVVVVNLLRDGTPEQRAANRAYGLQMMGLFAENAHGPMHMGRAVTLEGDARFNAVAIVYYPGIDYFLQMARSTFFNGIVGNKQPGDTLAIPTIPITQRL